MDVNKTTSIRPMGDDGSRKPPRKKLFSSDNEPSDEMEDESAGLPHQKDSQAFAIGGLLSEKMPEPMQLAFDSMVSELEQMRHKLECALRAEARFLEATHQHSFLPIVNRREFYRELSHILLNSDESVPPPGLFLLHLNNGGKIRRELGRGALDQALEKTCSVIADSLDQNDLVGSLGGNDFAVLLLSPTPEVLEERLEQLQQALQQEPFLWHHRKYNLDVSLGGGVLQSGQSAENAVAFADNIFVNKNK